VYVFVIGKNVGLVFGYQDLLTIAVKGLMQVWHSGNGIGQIDEVALCRV